MYSCHSILEIRMLCHVFWSQIEYKIVCFIFLPLTQIVFDNRFLDWDNLMTLSFINRCFLKFPI